MPRMHIWLAGTTTAAAATYVGYYHVYLPRTTTQKEFEAKLAIQNQHLQDVMQAYAQLMATVAQARARAALLAKQQQQQHQQLAGGSSGSSYSDRSLSPSRSDSERLKGEADTIDYETLIAGGSVQDAEPQPSTSSSSSSPPPPLPEDSVTAQRSMDYALPASRPVPQRGGGGGDEPAGPVPITGPILFTNKEKLLLYLGIQRVRWMLFRLPRTAQQTEKDQAAMLTALDQVEQECLCTTTTTGRVTPTAQGERGVLSGTPAPSVDPLNGALSFREAPLTVSQRLQCLLCYCLYVAVFRVVPLVLSCCPRLLLSPLLFSGFRLRTPAYLRKDVTGTRAAALLAYRLHMLYHIAASIIVRVLEVEVEMDISGEEHADGDGAGGGRFAVPYGGDAHRTGAKEEEEEEASRYIVMNPSHWLEEVGFWACRANPLLLPPPFLPTADCVTVSSPLAGPDGGQHKRSVLGRSQDRNKAGEVTGRVREGDEDRGSSSSSCPPRGDWSAKYPRLRVLSAPSTGILANVTDAATRAWWARTTTDPCGSSSSSSVATVWRNLCGVVGRSIRERPVARAFPVDYGVLWEAEWDQREKTEQEKVKRLRVHADMLRGRGDRDNSNDDGTLGSPTRSSGREESSPASSATPASPAAVRHGRSSLGYPLAVDVEALRAAEEAKAAQHDDKDMPTFPRFVPVGVAGLPRFLYVDESVGRPDCEPRSSSADIYAYLAEGQFRHAAPSSSSTGNMTNNREGEYSAAHDTAAAAKEKRKRALATAQKLTTLQQQRGFPGYAPLWWGSVYGGSSRRGKTTRRVLCYRLGRLQYPEELVEGMLAATEEAVKAAYAE